MQWWLRFKRRRAGLCVDCGEPLIQRIWEDEIHGENRHFSVTLAHVAYLGCSHPTHRKRFVLDEWMEKITIGFGTSRDFPHSRQTRWSKAFVCCRCVAKLRGESVSSRSQGSVRLEDAPVLQLNVQAPRLQCPDCRTLQIDARLVDDSTTLAFARAFRTINLWI